MSLADRGPAGFALLTLLYQRSDWILRRTERLTFDDALVVRRRTVLDLSLERFPRLDDDVLPRWGERALLPLMLVSRSEYYDIQVETATGESLPFLPRSDERKFLAAGLAELSLRLAELDGEGFADRGGEIDRRSALILDHVDRSPLRSVREMDDSLEPIREYLTDFVENHVVIATPALAEIVQEVGGHWTARGLVRLVECHAEGYPASDHLEFDVGRLEEALGQDPGFACAYAGHRVDRESEPHLWERNRHVDDWTITIPISQIQGAESVHVELVCPPGVYVDEAVLVSALRMEDGSIEILEIADDDRHWDAAHVHYSTGLLRLDATIDTTAQIDTTLLVVLRPMFHGLMHGGRNVSALAAVLLSLLAFTIGWRSAGWDPLIPLPLRATDTTDAIVAVLLLAPTAAIGLLIRHDEHMLTKHVGRQYRVRLGLLATVIFVASTVVAIGVDDWPVFAILLATSVAGLALAGVTAVSARRSERRVQSPPVPPTWFSA